MSSQKPKRFPRSALKRYADLILRHVYQSGGRERYVPIKEIEEELGLEQLLIFELCRSRLLGEVIVAWRLPAELEESFDFQTPIERQLIRDWFSVAHVRVRPEVVRLTADELVQRAKKRRKKKKKKRRKSRA